MGGAGGAKASVVELIVTKDIKMAQQFQLNTSHGFVLLHCTSPETRNSDRLDLYISPIWTSSRYLPQRKAYE